MGKACSSCTVVHSTMPAHHCSTSCTTNTNPANLLQWSTDWSRKIKSRTVIRTRRNTLIGQALSTVDSIFRRPYFLINYFIIHLTGFMVPDLNVHCTRHIKAILFMCRYINDAANVCKLQHEWTCRIRDERNWSVAEVFHRWCTPHKGGLCGDDKSQSNTPCIYYSLSTANVPTFFTSHLPHYSYHARTKVT